MARQASHRDEFRSKLCAKTEETRLNPLTFTPTSPRLTQVMSKRTYQPKKRRRTRVHGFFSRMSSRAGRLVLKRRRLKGRKRVAL